MNIIQNENVAFRCPNTLKEKLQKYEEENDLRVSAVIRTACVEYIRKEQSGIQLIDFGRKEIAR